MAAGKGLGHEKVEMLQGKHEGIMANQASGAQIAGLLVTGQASLRMGGFPEQVKRPCAAWRPAPPSLTQLALEVPAPSFTRSGSPVPSIETLILDGRNPQAVRMQAGCGWVEATELDCPQP